MEYMSFLKLRLKYSSENVLSGVGQNQSTTSLLTNLVIYSAVVCATAAATDTPTELTLPLVTK